MDEDNPCKGESGLWSSACSMRGQEAFKMSGKYNENASLNVAKNVPGFDMVLMGHDHARECKKVVNIVGDSVLIIDPASNGVVLSNVDVTLKLKDGKLVE